MADVPESPRVDQARRRRTAQTTAPMSASTATTDSTITGVPTPESSAVSSAASSVCASDGDGTAADVGVGLLVADVVATPAGAAATVRTGAGFSGSGTASVTGSIQASSRPSEYRCRVGNANWVASTGSWATVTLYSASTPGPMAGPASSNPSAVGVRAQPAGPLASVTSAGAMPAGSWVFMLTMPALFDSDSALKTRVAGPVPA